MFNEYDTLMQSLGNDVCVWPLIPRFLYGESQLSQLLEACDNGYNLDSFSASRRVPFESTFLHDMKFKANKTVTLVTFNMKVWLQQNSGFNVISSLCDSI